MRILIVNNYARITGGADRHCLDLAAALRERGHTVEFVSTGSNKDVERDGEFIAPAITRASRGSYSMRSKVAAAARAFWNRDAAAATRRCIERFQPDVLHVHKAHPHLSVAPLVVAHRAGLPVVQTVHDYEFISAHHADDLGSWIDRSGDGVPDQLLNTATYPLRRFIHGRRVSAWIAVSRFVADAYRSSGIPTEVLPNFTQVESEPAPSFEERNGIVFVGWLGERKGLPDVIQVARRLPQSSVSIAGSGPQEALAMAASNELPNLEFLGRMAPASVREFLRSAQVCLMPSHWNEPGTLVALEAMAVGTPIVCYPRGGLGEYVSDAGAGQLVAGGPHDLAAACVRLADPGRWNEASTNGVAAIERTHSTIRYVQRLEGIYGEVVAGRQDSSTRSKSAAI